MIRHILTNYVSILSTEINHNVSLLNGNNWTHIVIRATFFSSKKVLTRTQSALSMFENRLMMVSNHDP